MKDLPLPFLQQGVRPDDIKEGKEKMVFFIQFGWAKGNLHGYRVRLQGQVTKYFFEKIKGLIAIKS